MPNHVGILGNKKPDVAAKRAARRIQTLVPIPHTDSAEVATKNVNEKWEVTMAMKKKKWTLSQP